MAVKSATVDQVIYFRQSNERRQNELNNANLREQKGLECLTTKQVEVLEGPLGRFLGQVGPIQAETNILAWRFARAIGRC